MNSLFSRNQKSLAAVILLLGGGVAWEGRALVGGVVTQCSRPIGASMQRATGTATLGKVGVHVCSTVCPPIYYTVEESNYTDETLTDVLTGGVNCPPHNVTHHRRVNEGWITYYKFDAPDNPGPTLREGCTGTPKITTGVATGEVSLTGAGDDNCTASGTAASGVMSWMPPECYNTIGNALDQAPLEEISSQNRNACDYTETETVYQYIYYPTGCGTSTQTKP